MSHKKMCDISLTSLCPFATKRDSFTIQLRWIPCDNVLTSQRSMSNVVMW